MARMVQRESSNLITQTKQKHKKKLISACHLTHSFEWRLNGKKGKKPITITCNKLGTVRNSLRRSPQFREQDDKTKNKELVIERNDKPIPHHFPCNLLQPGERLSIKYVKAIGPRQPMAPLQSRIRSFNQMVEFNVLAKGGKNITRIFKNPALRSYSEVTVYGYKGEKVKHAMDRDGRFHGEVFQRTCALSDTNTIVELSNLVDDLGGKTFQIIMLNKNAPPESQQSSLEYSLESDQEAEENENHSKLVKLMPHEIPGSRALRSYLSSQISVSINAITNGSGNSGQVSLHDHLSVEFGRSQGSFTVNAMKTLMTNHCNSVCQVRINGTPAGSGFLLFNNFALTNFHVIKDAFSRNLGQLFQKVTLHFSYENVEEASPGHSVQEVVVYEYCIESQHKRDWALLSLTAEPDSALPLPNGLLTWCGFPPKSDSICIIGHPGGGVKKTDSTWIIPLDGRRQVIERHYNENLKHSQTVSTMHNDEFIQFQTKEFLNLMAVEMKNNQDLPYETCFSFGSSGSPVFDSDCNVVALHSGGYPYKLASGETLSVFEYGQLLSSILENLIVKLVHTDKLEVLKQFLEFPCNHRRDIMHNVKKLVESRNYTKFQNTANNLYVWNSPILKEFFEFICNCETESPMDMTR